jgi:hypothetical protein
MTLRPNHIALNQSKLRTASLEERLNANGQTPPSNAGQAASFSSLIQQKLPGLRWPLFSRLLSDALVSSPKGEWMRRELASIPVAFVDPGSNAAVPANTGSPRSTGIVPVRISEPIDAPKLQAAKAVELQLVGIPFVPTVPSRMQAWTPSFPIEIASIDSLAKKVELMRLIQSNDAMVGAAFSPAIVYDDVRLLADCGFDYVCLLLDVVPELALKASTLSLGSLHSSLESALKAIRDSGSNMRLWVAASATDAREMYSMIQQGVDAVCVDAYLKTVMPAESEAPKDRYASMLSMVAPQSSPFGWVRQVVEQIGLQLEDLRTYHGV